MFSCEVENIPRWYDNKEDGCGSRGVTVFPPSAENKTPNTANFPFFTSSDIKRFGLYRIQIYIINLVKLLPLPGEQMCILVLG